MTFWSKGKLALLLSLAALSFTGLKASATVQSSYAPLLGRGEYLLACKMVERSGLGVDDAKLHKALQSAYRVRDDTYMWKYEAVSKKVEALLEGSERPALTALLRRCRVEFPKLAPDPMRPEPTRSKPARAVPPVSVRPGPAANRYAPLANEAEYLFFCSSMTLTHPTIDAGQVMFDITASGIAPTFADFQRGMEAAAAKAKRIAAREPNAMKPLIRRCEQDFG